MSLRSQVLGMAGLLSLMLSLPGCLHFSRGFRTCCPEEASGCDPCGEPCCDPCGYRRCGRLGACGHKLGTCLTNADMRICSALYHRSNAIPETLPLGSTNRAWYQAMQTNAEAADFIIYRRQFVGKTARLTPEGRDHIWEIAARMRSTPFPVIIERSENNSDPELDALRRQLVVQILTDFGNADADQRTVVAPSYGPGYSALKAEPMYYQHISVGGFGGNNFGTFGNNFGQFGGFGGGAGGGIGFGP